MTTEDYERLAMRTEADQDKILVRLMSLGANAMRLDNAARGLAGDAGEVASAVMKYIEYGRDLDRVNLMEEVGDCLWRLAQVCKAGGFSMADAMEGNIRKLRKRYPDNYSDYHAAEENRDRKAEAEAVIAEHKAVAPFGRDYLGDPRKVPHPNDVNNRDPVTGNLMPVAKELGERFLKAGGGTTSYVKEFGPVTHKLCGELIQGLMESQRNRMKVADATGPAVTLPPEIKEQPASHHFCDPQPHEDDEVVGVKCSVCGAFTGRRKLKPCDHQWQTIQTVAGSGMKCLTCGKVEPF